VCSKPPQRPSRGRGARRGVIDAELRAGIREVIGDQLTCIFVGWRGARSIMSRSGLVSPKSCRGTARLHRHIIATSQLPFLASRPTIVTRMSCVAGHLAISFPIPSVPPVTRATHCRWWLFTWKPQLGREAVSRIQPERRRSRAASPLAGSAGPSRLPLVGSTKCGRILVSAR